MKTADKYQDFFNFMNQEHNLLLTIEEMDEIVFEVGKLVNKLNERNSVDEGEKSSYRMKKCKSCGCEFEANIATLCYRCWSEEESKNNEILKNEEG